jgi:hypothetical protein
MWTSRCSSSVRFDGARSPISSRIGAGQGATPPASPPFDSALRIRTSAPAGRARWAKSDHPRSSVVDSGGASTSGATEACKPAIHVVVESCGLFEAVPPARKLLEFWQRLPLLGSIRPALRLEYISESGTGHLDTIGAEAEGSRDEILVETLYFPRSRSVGQQVQIAGVLLLNGERAQPRGVFSQLPLRVGEGVRIVSWEPLSPRDGLVPSRTWQARRSPSSRAIAASASSRVGKSPPTAMICPFELRSTQFHAPVPGYGPPLQWPRSK